MRDLSAGELMTENLETVSTISSAQEASKKMRDKNVSSLVVIEANNNRPTGIVTERDLVRKACVSGIESEQYTNKRYNVNLSFRYYRF